MGADDVVVVAASPGTVVADVTLGSVVDELTLGRGRPTVVSTKSSTASPEPEHELAEGQGEPEGPKGRHHSERTVKVPPRRNRKPEARPERQPVKIDQQHGGLMGLRPGQLPKRATPVEVNFDHVPLIGGASSQ